MPKHGALLAVATGLVMPFLVACSVFSQATAWLTPKPTALPPGYTVSGKTRGDPNAKVTLVEFADFQ